MAAARQAEELGFADVWVSDHLAIPKDAPYPPSAYMLEPLVTGSRPACAGASRQDARVPRPPLGRTSDRAGRAIPIWIGGHSEPACRRAVRLGDGWHGGFQPVARAAQIVERLRRERPERSFTLSMRTRWDALRDDPDQILGEIEGYREIGIQQIVAEPAQRDQASWLRCGEAFARIFERAR